jgi:hypothetical protein
MSGGRFDYNQNYIPRILESLEEINESDLEEYTDEEKVVIEVEIESISEWLQDCYIRLHRLDYLLSGDDSFESYKERLRKDFEIYAELKS